jgi:replicative DNA helicase
VSRAGQRATPSPLPEKLPPHDVEAEKSVIASLLVDTKATDRVAPILQPVDFFREALGWVYEACLTLRGRSEAINQITVAHELARRNRLEEIGGNAYLSRLVAELPTAIGVEHYARIVRRDAVYRQLVTASGYIAQIAYTANGNLPQVLAEAEGQVRAARDMAEPLLKVETEPPPTAKQLLATDFGDASPIIDDGGEGAVISREEKSMLAGPPGVGKTNIGLRSATCLAAGAPVLGLPVPAPVRVAYVNLENSPAVIQRRLRKITQGCDDETLERLFIVNLRGLDLSTDRGVSTLVEIASRSQADILFIDPLRNAHPWDENRSDDAAMLIAALDSVIDATGVAMILVHHVRKPDPHKPKTYQTLDQVRGSTHLAASMETVLLVNEDPQEDRLMADFVKTRNAERRLPPMHLYFDRNALDYEVEVRPEGGKLGVESIVNAVWASGGSIDGPELVAGLVEGSGASERTVRDTIRRAVKQNRVVELPPGPHGRKRYGLPPETPEEASE